MQLKFEHLDYQQNAIFSIVDLFQGEIKHSDDGDWLNAYFSVANQLNLSGEDIADNLKRIQQKNNLPISVDDKNPLTYPYHFTVEMETGTGKTYVYLRTIFELNKQYGWRKFIIVVPSVAIREGVLQTLKATQNHFADDFDNVAVNFYEYQSDKLTRLKQFATSCQIEILVMNIQTFEKEINTINQINESGETPLCFIQNSRPIVLIDEPQNMQTDGRKQAIFNLNPLFCVGYSATHKQDYHKVYGLNPVQAYELNLVKKIVVNSVVADNDVNGVFLQLLDVGIKNKKPYAKICLNVKDKHEIKNKTITVKTDDDLFEKSGNNYQYQNGFLINGIDTTSGQVSLNNGRILTVGEQISDWQDDLMKAQIHQTIKEHIAKERQLHGMGIKVLSLFFIDKVANYRNNGKFYRWFVELYEQETGQTADGVHDGYFSQDKNGDKDTNGNTKADNQTYELIMKDKARLLSLDEPLRFIFSHSALKEGWDNPNVFQICTLNETTSAIKKRQELGRGLRLPVNQHGERIYDQNINTLTVIANESYETFAKTLQSEYEADGIAFDKANIKNKANERTLSYRFDAFSDPLFLAIWQKINQKTHYQVNFDVDELIQKASHAIKNQLHITPPKLRINQATISQSMTDGVQATQIASFSQTLTARHGVPDVLGELVAKTGLTRQTVFAILKHSGRIDEIKINPQRFIDMAGKLILRQLQTLMVDGICYHKIDGVYCQQALDCFVSYSFFANDYTFRVVKSNKTIYNGFIPLDSDTEYQFAKDCENFDPQVKFYFKLPPKFKIPTPIGNYNPDWAVIWQNGDETKQAYFVAETKNTGKSVQGGVAMDKLRQNEQLKIACAKRHFAALDGIGYQVVVRVGELGKD